MSILTLLVVFFGLIVVGAPIAVALGGSVIVSSLIFSPIPLAIVGQKVLANLDHVTLMAVPFFFFAAALMETGGLVQRLIRLANALVGHWRGGLGLTSVGSCTLFAAISGSSPATVAAIGRILYPSLVREGYTPAYAIGALVTAGSIGILIPPSIPMIIYGFVTETSVIRLFLAGVIPGLMYATGLMLMARWLARSQQPILSTRPSAGERWAIVREALPSLSLPVFLLVGIYGLPAFNWGWLAYEGGAIFTPTEAAIMGCLLAFVVGKWVYRELSVRSALQAVIRTAPSVGMIFFIATNALLFAYFITKMGLPQAVTQLLLDLKLSKEAFLMIVNVLLTIVGFFLEGVPTILMFVPVIFPAAMALGVDPVHLGIIIIINIELGLVTPPVGLNLFVGSSISGQPVGQVFKAALPWMSVTLVMLLLVTYIPSLSLYLPNLLMPG
jgi:C4-dicarboxylate transporter DctM subunit